jgi:hypothetical protein
MADAVSRRPLPAVAQVRSRAITCEICGAQIDNNRFFSQYLDFSPVSINLPLLRNSLRNIILRRTSGRSIGTIERGDALRISGEHVTDDSVNRPSASQDITSICYGT